MSTVESMEARWFVDGALPETVERWFRGSGELEPEKEVRPDRYLHLPRCATTGVKVRNAGAGGKALFEVKALLEGGHERRFGDGAAGIVERWTKWSVGGPEVEPLVGRLAGESTGWITVEKRRLLRKVKVEGGAACEVDAKSRPAAGCGFELTAIAAPKPAWSIGFEAFGAPAQLASIFEHAVAEILRKYPLPGPLPTTQSRSYPRWLGDL